MTAVPRQRNWNKFLLKNILHMFLYVIVNVVAVIIPYLVKF